MQSTQSKEISGNSHLRPGRRILLAGVALGITACGQESAPREQICSPIVKIEQINKPLSWGERTLDEVAAGAKFRAVYFVIDQHDKDTGRQEPHEISLEDGFALSVGDQFCE